ncbi:MAG TPA: type II secretion system protein N [Rhodanobacteraceae bacterium]
MPTGFANFDRRAFEQGAAAICLVLGALAIWLLARLIWLLVPRGDVALGTATPQVGDSGPAPARSIAKWHLFGNTPLAAAGVGGAGTLAMILRGTLADRDPAAGIAVIGDSERGELAFRAGEEIAPGAKLARVYPDHVVVLRDGAEETLKLTRDENLMPGNIVRAPTNPSGRPGTAAAAAGTSASAGTLGTATTTRAPADWQQTVDRLRQNPGELARRVPIEPVLDGNRLTGVRISAAADATLLGRIGLRAGDVVTAINGAPVNSIARGEQIVDSLRTASSARVTVMRDGKPTDITISLK